VAAHDGEHSGAETRAPSGWTPRELSVGNWASRSNLTAAFTQ